MTYSNHVRPESLKSLSDITHTPFWLDDPLRPDPQPALIKQASTDLLIIGAGFSGLWTALLAKEENPSRDVIVLEAGEVATGATGRNGGFMDASITHGFSRTRPSRMDLVMGFHVGNSNFPHCSRWGSKISKRSKRPSHATTLTVITFAQVMLTWQPSHITLMR